MFRLPINPPIFIVSYLLLVLVAILIAGFTTGLWLYLAMMSALLCLVLHIFWAYSSAKLISKLSSHNRNNAVILADVRTSLLIASVAVIAIVVYSGLLRSLLSSMQGGIVDQFVGLALFLVFFFFFFRLFWVIAKGLCQAEAQREVPAHKVVGTFLLFFYLVIGAPFIFRRLKNLIQQRSQCVS